MGEEHDLSTVLGLEGYDEKYSDVSAFSNYLGADDPLSTEKYGTKWVFWAPEAYQKSPIIQDKIKSLVSKGIWAIWHNCLIQFWVPKVVGKRCYLSTSDQPFAVGDLHKGLCWYRKLCMDHIYIVGEDAKEEELGAVGRVFLNGYPESSPDLRLYSTKELPFRDHAARCGARGYVVLPVFDLLNKECYGVLEILLFFREPMRLVFELVVIALQEAELRSTHLKTPSKYNYQSAEGEIGKMLQAARQAVPQLHMAQAWVRCKQCANTSTDLCCMEIVLSINAADNMVIFQNGYRLDYVEASNFHHLQAQKGIIAKTVMSSNIKSCFCQNLCDFSIIENPLAHYAQKSRLSFCFAICLQSVHNSDDLYYVEFFLQSSNRQDPCGASLPPLLMGVMETTLKSFKVTSSDQQQIVVEVRKDVLSNSIEFVPHNLYGIREHELVEKHQYSRESNLLSTWNGCEPLLEFEKYLQMDDHFSCLKSRQVGFVTWLFWCPEREELCQYDSSFLQSSTQSKIKCLLDKLVSYIVKPIYLVQFWAPKMIEDRCYLATSGQTFALSGLHKGLAFFRKQYMKHHYLVDEGVKEEELGPIGRVFRSGHLEITHDMSLYSTTEFPLKNDAAFCNLTKYIAFPVFDHQHKCLGVLEFIGIDGYIEDTLKCIQKSVKEAHLSSTHINYKPKFQARFELTLNEIKEAFQLVNRIPQLRAAEVWVPNNDCANTNNSLRCMQRVLCSDSRKGVLFDHVETGKGILGMVLASENKCCYSKKSCQFSITEQSRPHHAQRKRLDVWFAICLQNSHTGDLPYVLKFFLNQGPRDYEYLWSFLYFLLPILKRQLKSFKVATGKQLGEELVVDIIEFSKVNQPTLFQLGQSNMFPVKCQIVQYGQQEHQQSNDHQANEMDHGTSVVAQEKQCSTPVANSEKKEETSRKIESGKRKTGLRITLEDLEGQFGKSRKDAAENLFISISTFKRACRFHDINRWPSNKKHGKNPSLFMTKNANEYDGDPEQNTGPSSSSLGLPVHQNVPPTNTESNQDLSVLPETDLVIIKAKYEDDIVKFQFCLSSGIDKLAEEVATRINLEMGTFKLKYVDEDDDHISLTCDADVQLYVRSLKDAGKNCIPVFVQLIRAK